MEPLASNDEEVRDPIIDSINDTNDTMHTCACGCGLMGMGYGTGCRTGLYGLGGGARRAL